MFRKFHRRAGTVAGAVLAAVGLTACGSHTVTYKVSGTGSLGINYTKGSNPQLQSANANGSWSKTYTSSDSPLELSLDVTSLAPGAQVSCSVVVDGKTVVQAHASGSGKPASCEKTLS